DARHIHKARRTSDQCAAREYFFSSRRRHTSFSRDWSSDVCSSDLKAARLRAESIAAQDRNIFLYEWVGSKRIQCRFHYGPFGLRSEERRVGKECRSRWGPNNLTINYNSFRSGWRSHTVGTQVSERS